MLCLLQGKINNVSVKNMVMEETFTSSLLVYFTFITSVDSVKNVLQDTEAISSVSPVGIGQSTWFLDHHTLCVIS